MSDADLTTRSSEVTRVQIGYARIGRFINLFEGKITERPSVLYHQIEGFKICSSPLISSWEELQLAMTSPSLGLGLLKVRLWCAFDNKWKRLNEPVVYTISHHLRIGWQEYDFPPFPPSLASTKHCEKDIYISNLHHEHAIVPEF